MSRQVLETDIVIQRAALHDVDALVALEQESFTVPWSRKMFEVEITSNQFGHLYLARSSSKDGLGKPILGYVCFWCVFEELRFLNLAVAPFARKQGIGQGLVSFALAYGKRLGTDKALLEVRTSNDPARQLYGHFGFQEYGQRKAYYTNPDEDAILMRLESFPEDLVRKFSSQNEEPVIMVSDQPQ